MSRLHLTTPWARQYLPEAERPEVEARIPDGFELHVGAGRAPGKPWSLRLYWAEDRSEPVWHTNVYMADLREACLFALDRHARDAA